MVGDELFRVDRDHRNILKHWKSRWIQIVLSAITDHLFSFSNGEFACKKNRIKLVLPMEATHCTKFW